MNKFSCRYGYIQIKLLFENFDSFWILGFGDHKDHENNYPCFKLSPFNIFHLQITEFNYILLIDNIHTVVGCQNIT